MRPGVGRDARGLSATPTLGWSGRDLRPARRRARFPEPAGKQGGGYFFDAITRVANSSITAASESGWSFMMSAALSLIRRAAMAPASS